MFDGKWTQFLLLSMLPFLTTPASVIASLVLVKSENFGFDSGELKIIPLALNATEVLNILQLP